MTKKEIKKKAHKAIIDQGRTHQDVYDELATSKPSFNKEIATALSEIPSRGIRAKYQTLLYVYMGLLGLIGIIRMLGIGVLLQGNINPLLLLSFLALSLVLPGFGIYGAYKSKLHLLQSTSIVFILFTGRTLMKIGFQVEELIWIIPVAIVVALGFYLPYVMKTPYTLNVVKADPENGKSSMHYDIQFKEILIPQDDELLDNDHL